MILANETLVTDFADVGLGAGVQAHVSSQIGFMIELFDALVAFKRFVPIVFGHVLGMRLIAWKTLSTTSTLERFFTAMERFIMLG